MRFTFSHRAKEEGARLQTKVNFAISAVYHLCLALAKEDQPPGIFVPNMRLAPLYCVCAQCEFGRKKLNGKRGWSFWCSNVMQTARVSILSILYQLMWFERVFDYFGWRAVFHSLLSKHYGRTCSIKPVCEHHAINLGIMVLGNLINLECPNITKYYYQHILYDITERTFR